MRYTGWIVGTIIISVLICLGCDSAQSNTTPPPLATTNNYVETGVSGSGATSIVDPGTTNVGQQPVTPGVGGASGMPNTGGASGITSTTPPSTQAGGPAPGPGPGPGPVDMDSGVGNDGGPAIQPGPTEVTNPTQPPTPTEPPTPIVASSDPIIPDVTGDCPRFATGNFNYMGLTGIMNTGPMGSGDGSIVFHWHGTLMGASTVSMLGTNIQRVTNEGGIIISPNGPASGEGGDVICSGTAIFGAVTTFKIVDQMVACAVRDYNINPRRVYATGCSAGGLQSGCMAAQRSSYTAAVAPNSGGLVMPMGYQDPSRIPAVFTMHGAPGVDVVVIDFSQSSATLDNQTKSAGGFAVNCNHGGMHCGAPAAAYTAAFDFLFAHPFGIDTEPYASGLPPNFPSYCKIF